MAYRNGTYVAFHANNTPDPAESDMKYYQLLNAWKVRDEEGDFHFVDSHEKTNARDEIAKSTLREHLRERLRNSKNMILIIGQTTRLDNDWVPFEINYAIDSCQIPIIAAYPGFLNITDPAKLANLWPPALNFRIASGAAKAIHIPFKKEPLIDAVGQFDFDHMPKSSLSYYNLEVYEKWGLVPEKILFRS